MTTRNRVFLLTITGLVAGCASQPMNIDAYVDLAQTPSINLGNLQQQPEFSEPGLKPDRPGIGLQDRAFYQLLEAEITLCKEQADQYRGQFENHRSTAKKIAGIGIIAGSIAAPALLATSASAAIVATVSGVSGAANAYQLSLNAQGESPMAAATAYQDFITRINEIITEELPKIQTGQDATIGLLRLRTYCAFPPLPPTSAMPNTPTEMTLATQKLAAAELRLKAETAQTEAAKQRALRDKLQDQPEKEENDLNL